MLISQHLAVCNLFPLPDNRLKLSFNFLIPQNPQFSCLCRYGLAEGTLVKVSCLGPIAGSKVGGASETLEAAEGQQAAEEVAAAADAETRKSTLKVSASATEQDQKQEFKCRLTLVA